MSQAFYPEEDLAKLQEWPDNWEDTPWPEEGWVNWAIYLILEYCVMCEAPLVALHTEQAPTSASSVPPL